MALTWESSSETTASASCSSAFTSSWDGPDGHSTKRRSTARHDGERRLAGPREQDVDLSGAGTEAEPHQKITLTGYHRSAATSAAAGIVRIHAKTMFPATPQRTAESRFVAPAPITAPETTWVVESG